MTSAIPMATTRRTTATTNTGIPIRTKSANFKIPTVLSTNLSPQNLRRARAFRRFGRLELNVFVPEEVFPPFTDEAGIVNEVIKSIIATNEAMSSFFIPPPHRTSHHSAIQG